jgi:hypothetical protein
VTKIGSQIFQQFSKPGEYSPLPFIVVAMFKHQILRELWKCTPESLNYLEMSRADETMFKKHGKFTYLTEKLEKKYKN